MVGDFSGWVFLRSIVVCRLHGIKLNILSKDIKKQLLFSLDFIKKKVFFELCIAK